MRIFLAIVFSSLTTIAQIQASAEAEAVVIANAMIKSIQLRALYEAEKQRQQSSCWVWKKDRKYLQSLKKEWDNLPLQTIATLQKMEKNSTSK